MLSLLLGQKSAMSEDTYLYVDGESHYICTAKYWEKLHPAMPLETLVLKDKAVQNTGLEGGIHHDPKCKFFWHGQLTSLIGVGPYYINRAVYFTSVVGTDQTQHEAATLIRAVNFEPQVILERQDLAKQRANELKDRQMIVKPKGLDIALTVRMLEDAHRGLFRRCFLAASDADYLPLIRAVRQLGKQVFVLAYGEFLTKDKPEFAYVPDKYINLCEVLNRPDFYQLADTKPPIS